MSDMNVRDLYDFFSFPRWWEIRDSDSDTSNTRMHRIIKTVDRYSATHSDTCNPKYVHRNVYSERFCEQSEYPYECEWEREVESYAEPDTGEKIWIPRPSIIIVMCEYWSRDEAHREYGEDDGENEVLSFTVIEVSGEREVEERVSEEREE